MASRFSLVLPVALLACGAHEDRAASEDAGLVLTPVSADASATTDADAACPPVSRDASNRFITQVIRFTQGTCAGYGACEMPGVVEGPPVGGGAGNGGTDVVSLGGGGEIVVGFGDNGIVDDAGPDFVVFENPFDYGSDRYVEPGEVSVSNDGVHWTAFPCTDTTQNMPDGGWGATHCAGMNLVFSTPSNGISPFDLAHAGGDQFNLAEIGVKSAKYVRIRNMVNTEYCPGADAGPDVVRPTKNGFDLDAIAIINAAVP